MAKTPEEMANDMTASLPEKTGKSLKEWKTLLKTKSFSKHKEIITFLKSDFGLTHGYANLIALKYLKSDAESIGSADELVDAMFGGEKASLRPVYDKIIQAVNDFGPDVDIAPKKAYVSLRRKKQFAVVQPSTKTRVDVGINLKEEKAGKRLEKSGSFNSMVSHRVRLSGAGDVDSELIGWLKKAYQES